MGDSRESLPDDEHEINLARAKLTDYYNTALIIYQDIDKLVSQIKESKEHEKYENQGKKRLEKLHAFLHQPQAPSLPELQRVCADWDRRIADVKDFKNKINKLKEYAENTSNLLTQLVDAKYKEHWKEKIEQLKDFLTGSPTLKQLQQTCVIWDESVVSLMKELEKLTKQAPSTKPVLRTFGDELSACGKNWGKDVDLSGAGDIKKHTGAKSWIETAVPGVIGMHGNEAGKGPSVVIKDVEHSDIDMIWTNNLVGCMGLAITGRDDQGRLDVFFSHARQYEAPNATQDKDNPMSLAKEFVSSHQNLQVYWGTDFSFGETKSGESRTIVIQTKKTEAQKLLSKELGCWVRLCDCNTSENLVFFPKLGIMKEGSPFEAYRSVQTEDLEARSAYSKSKELSRFEPDATILKNLEDHLAQIKKDKSSMIRFYLYDERRSNKINVLEKIVDAYKIGNFDVLRHFALFAKDKSSPTRDESEKNTWSAIDESVTAQLVINAHDDALLKIRAMGTNGCGLSSHGSDVSYKDYKKLISSPQPSVAKSRNR